MKAVQHYLVKPYVDFSQSHPWVNNFNITICTIAFAIFNAIRTGVSFSKKICCCCCLKTKSTRTEQETKVNQQKKNISPTAPDDNQEVSIDEAHKTILDSIAADKKRSLSETFKGKYSLATLPVYQECLTPKESRCKPELMTDDVMLLNIDTQRAGIVAKIHNPCDRVLYFYERLDGTWTLQECEFDKMPSHLFSKIVTKNQDCIVPHHLLVFEQLLGGNHSKSKLGWNKKYHEIKALNDKFPPFVKSIIDKLCDVSKIDCAERKFDKGTAATSSVCFYTDGPSLAFNITAGCKKGFVILSPDNVGNWHCQSDFPQLIKSGCFYTKATENLSEDIDFKNLQILTDQCTHLLQFTRYTLNNMYPLEEDDYIFEKSKDIIDMILPVAKNVLKTIFVGNYRFQYLPVTSNTVKFKPPEPSEMVYPVELMLTPDHKPGFNILLNNGVITNIISCYLCDNGRWELICENHDFMNSASLMEIHGKGVNEEVLSKLQQIFKEGSIKGQHHTWHLGHLDKQENKINSDMTQSHTTLVEKSDNRKQASSSTIVPANTLSPKIDEIDSGIDEPHKEVLDRIDPQIRTCLNQYFKGTYRLENLPIYPIQFASMDDKIDGKKIQGNAALFTIAAYSTAGNEFRTGIVIKIHSDNNYFIYCYQRQDGSWYIEDLDENVKPSRIYENGDKKEITPKNIDQCISKENLLKIQTLLDTGKCDTIHLGWKTETKSTTNEKDYLIESIPEIVRNLFATFVDLSKLTYYKTGVSFESTSENLLLIKTENGPSICIRVTDGSKKGWITFVSGKDLNWYCKSDFPKLIQQGCFYNHADKKLDPDFSISHLQELVKENAIKIDSSHFFLGSLIDETFDPEETRKIVAMIPQKIKEKLSLVFKNDYALPKLPVSSNQGICKRTPTPSAFSMLHSVEILTKIDTKEVGILICINKTGSELSECVFCHQSGNSWYLDCSSKGLFNLKEGKLLESGEFVPGAEEEFKKLNLLFDCLPITNSSGSWWLDSKE